MSGPAENLGNRPPRRRNQLTPLRLSCLISVYLGNIPREVARGAFREFCRDTDENYTGEGETGERSQAWGKNAHVLRQAFSRDCVHTKGKFFFKTVVLRSIVPAVASRFLIHWRVCSQKETPQESKTHCLRKILFVRLQAAVVPVDGARTRLFLTVRVKKRETRVRSVPYPYTRSGLLPRTRKCYRRPLKAIKNRSVFTLLLYSICPGNVPPTSIKQPPFLVDRDGTQEQSVSLSGSPDRPQTAGPVHISIGDCPSQFVSSGLPRTLP